MSRACVVVLLLLLLSGSGSGRATTTARSQGRQRARRTCVRGSCRSSCSLSHSCSCITALCNSREARDHVLRKGRKALGECDSTGRGLPRVRRVTPER